jgi:hypothetical protein
MRNIFLFNQTIKRIIMTSNSLSNSFKSQPKWINSQISISIRIHAQMTPDKYTAQCSGKTGPTHEIIASYHQHNWNIETSFELSVCPQKNGAFVAFYVELQLCNSHPLEVHFDIYTIGRKGRLCQDNRHTKFDPNHPQKKLKRGPTLFCCF